MNSVQYEAELAAHLEAIATWALRANGEADENFERLLDYAQELLKDHEPRTLENELNDLHYKGDIARLLRRFPHISQKNFKKLRNLLLNEKEDFEFSFVSPYMVQFLSDRTLEDVQSEKDKFAELAADFGEQSIQVIFPND